MFADNDENNVVISKNELDSFFKSAQEARDYKHLLRIRKFSTLIASYAGGCLLSIHISRSALFGINSLLSGFSLYIALVLFSLVFGAGIWFLSGAISNFLFSSDDGSKVQIWTCVLIVLLLPVFLLIYQNSISQ